MKTYGKQTKRRSGVRWVLASAVLALALTVSACGGPSAPAQSSDRSQTTKSAAAQTPAASSPAAAQNTAESTQNRDDQAPANVPQAVIDKALTGRWEYSYQLQGNDFVTRWVFNEDGTGSFYSNGMEMPIVSYVATRTPFTQYPEDGFLLTVYWGPVTQTFGDVVSTVEIDPTEYGYLFHDETLRIVYSRDIAGDFVDFTRR